MSGANTFSLAEVFSDRECNSLAYVYEQYRHNSNLLHDKLVEHLAPMLDKINQRLGQQNDINYFAYAVEHVMNKAYHAAHDMNW